MTELHFSRGTTIDRESAEFRSLLLALVLSILVHALVAIVSVKEREGGDVGARSVVFARLVSRAAVAVAAGEEQIDNGVEPLGIVSDDRPTRIEEGIGSDEQSFPKHDANPSSGVTFAKQEYFSSESLTVRPYPITLLADVEATEIGPGEMFGRTVLKVWISATGGVAAMETEFSDMPEPFRRAAVAAFERMRFMPGQVDGKPVGSIIKIEIGAEDFRLPLQ
ncbi:energy transducer TonB [Dechloromonas denitrificans]|uniref:energy transducer TonB n=1 Tax=Dechloromonas denitrificans TaxID=281362 RepID=UPI001CF924FD|nr:energy transducer TonB [Dechloromonas denitrificans]UCV02489.1 hypothetical protein KI611_15560 [Dechloromonas denitrificans]